MASERAVAVVTGGSMMTDTARFEHAQRVANVFANSQLVPAHLRGKVADCVIAMNIAERLGEDPLTIMQSIYIVGGKAGWSSSYMIARINKSGLIKGRITWDVKGNGKDLEVTAKATLADTGEVVTATASFAMAIAEDWIKNKKYSSMPEQMLRFRSAAMLQRLYFPEVMLGMRTAEELETEPAAPVDITPAKTTRSALDQFAADPAPAEIVDVVDADGVIEAAPAPAAAPEPSQSSAEAEIGDALEHALRVLEKLPLEEIAGARKSIKQELKADDFAVWNLRSFERERELRGRR
jgi:hypothetical protein